MMMDKKDKYRWTEALRSGKYKQGYGVLRRRTNMENPDTFCCLGVNADLIAPGKWEFGRDCWHHDGTEAMPSREMQVAMGITAGQACILSDLNDDDRLTFPEIADWIEKEL